MLRQLWPIVNERVPVRTAHPTESVALFPTTCPETVLQDSRVILQVPRTLPSALSSKSKKPSHSLSSVHFPCQLHLPLIDALLGTPTAVLLRFFTPGAGPSAPPETDLSVLP